MRASSYPHYLPPRPALALQTGARTRRCVPGLDPNRMHSPTTHIRGLDRLLFPTHPLTTFPKTTLFDHAAFFFLAAYGHSSGFPAALGASTETSRAAHRPKTAASAQASPLP